MSRKRLAVEQPRRERPRLVPIRTRAASDQFTAPSESCRSLTLSSSLAILRYSSTICL